MTETTETIVTTQTTEAEQAVQAAVETAAAEAVPMSTAPAPVLMADGISSDATAIHDRFGQTMPVACYVNGFYAWTPAQEHMFGRKVRVSVEAGQPAAAKYARVLDVERGAAAAADVRPFLAMRRQEGHLDGTVYCSASMVGDVVRAAGTVDAIPRWWIAWYWQRPGQPSKDQVLAEVSALTGVAIPAGRLWACQYATFAQWDLSVVYGPYDWSR